MSRIVQIIYIILLTGISVYAQNITMTIAAMNAKPGDTIYIPVKVTNFNNIGAVSLYIEYDNTVINYLGVSSIPDYGNFTNNTTGNTLIIGWFGTTALNLGNNKFADLRFIYRGGTCTLNFNSSFCEIASVDGTVLQVQFNNGKINSATVGVKSKEIQEVEKFTLYQNYPNPFNPTTKISYSIPVDSRVNLSVYAITGERVIELINTNQSAGSYTIDFNASNLANGIYIYKIQAGNFVQSRKMLLVK